MQQAVQVFLLDNFDSFSYNLVDEIRSLGYPLKVYRNSVSAPLIFAQMQQSAAAGEQVILILSPGPGSPEQAGCMPELLQLVCGHFPVLGICLGHQAIIQHYGGNIVRADEVMHGKSSAIAHSGEDMFANLPQPLPVARYHSLMGKDIPPALEVVAQIEQIPMAVCHRQHKLLGFQFHPESILTSQGSQLLRQSIDYLSQTALSQETRDKEQGKSIEGIQL